MASFSDRLQDSIDKSKSFLCAGMDPAVKDFPAFIIQGASGSRDDLIYKTLTSFYEIIVEAIEGRVAIVKPNIAFFEQYGLAGLRAYHDVCKMAKAAGLPVIADAKRGDIGSTAQAYSAAFLGRSEFGGEKFPVFDVDALTVNPFLGFDTLEVFLKDCLEYGKGIFVLVKTSNPGSGDTQGKIGAGTSDAPLSLSERVAAWLSEKAATLSGESGFSGLGAVVGATYPAEAARLRTLMPSNIFLIPGMGAQGGTARDAVAGFGKGTSGQRGGAVINVSRGLLGGFPPSVTDRKSLVMEVRNRAQTFNQQIAEALA